MQNTKGEYHEAPRALDATEELRRNLEIALDKICSLVNDNSDTFKVEFDLNLKDGKLARNRLDIFKKV